jgi:hypothetical protein
MFAKGFFAELEVDMKLRLILVLLALVSGISSAEWTELGMANRKNTTYFVDLTTKQQAPDGKTTLAYLFDLRKAGECGLTAQPYLSSTGDHQFDCKAKLYRVLSCTRYSDHMASGDVVSVAGDLDGWSQIPPRSKVAHMYKVACGSVF